MKYIVFIISLSFELLFGASQLVIVTANEFNSTTATLQRYELLNETFQTVGEKLHVNIGRNGLGWSLSKIDIPHKKSDPVKREGDGRSPAGVFFITGSFGYFDAPNKKLPHIQSSDELICVDDVNASTYNTITTRSQSDGAKSFELMRPKDNVYELGLTLSHNQDKVPHHGSCIFLHVEKAKNSPTAGCTSMSIENLNTLVKWLNISKRPLLIQVPKHYLPEVIKLLDTFKLLWSHSDPTPTLPYPVASLLHDDKHSQTPHSHQQ